MVLGPGGCNLHDMGKGMGRSAPDGFYQAPLTVTDKVEIIKWETPVFEEAPER